MPLSRRLTVLLLLCVASACASSARGRTPGGTRDDYEIYAAILDYPLVPREPCETHRIEYHAVLDRQVTRWEPAEFVGERSRGAYKWLKSLQESTMRSFDAAQGDLGAIGGRIESYMPVRLVDTAMSEQWSSTDDYWTPFWLAFPRATARWGFSPVGYSSDGKQALVYYELGRHGRFGTGQLALLEHTERGWRVIETSAAWWT